jgi:hypothetical protein
VHSPANVVLGLPTKVVAYSIVQSNRRVDTRMATQEIPITAENRREVVGEGLEDDAESPPKRSELTRGSRNGRVCSRKEGDGQGGDGVDDAVA